MTPAVTVLLPFRRARPWLDRAARSIQADGLGDLELWLLADGAQTEELALARRLVREDRRLRLLSAPHRGLVDTLQRALALVRSPLVARMDADDVSLPGRLAAQALHLERHPSVAVVDGQVEIFRDDGPTLGGMAAFQGWLDSLCHPGALRAGLFVDAPLVHPAILARTEVLRRVGGYFGEGPEDYHLWLRVVEAGWDLDKLPQRVLRWRDHGARLTRTDERYARERFQRLKWEFLHRLGILSPGRRIAFWGAGRDARVWLRALREAGHHVVGVVDIDPHKQGTTRHGFPTFGLDALGRLPWEVILCAVGARGARAQIEDWCQARGIPSGPAPGQAGLWMLA